MNALKKGLFFIGLVALSQVCVAQDAPANYAPAKAVHDSKVRVHTARITMPDGKIARIKMREGEMGTITFLPDGHGIGITPTTSTTNADQVVLKIVNITVDADKKEVFDKAAVIHVGDKGEASYIHEGASFKIEMLNEPVARDAVTKIKSSGGTTLAG